MLEPILQKRILDNLSTAVVVINSKLAITYINPAAEVMFETSVKSINQQPFNVLFYEDENSEAELLSALKTGHPFTKREVLISCSTIAQQEASLTVNYSVAVIQEPNSEHLLLIEFQGLDRLLKISKDEDLLNTQQATKALLRGMAHEVKNPLGGIKGAAQLLLRELDDENQHEYINVVIEEADRLRNLVDRMLGPRTLPNIQPHNIHEILEHICQLKTAEPENDIVIQKDYDPSIPDIAVDREQMIQACLNILGNAFQVLSEQADVSAEDASQKGNLIAIRTRVLRQFTIGTIRHNMVIKIDFIDNGPGIPEEIKDTLFYPMVSGRAQGTGLGLSIAQTIINQFQGLIECDSRKGETVFSILLPLNLS